MTQTKTMQTVVAICGSPRREGNTEILVDGCLRAVEEEGMVGEKIRLSELRLNPCTECGGCQKTGECVIQDDMQKIYALLRKAKGIIVASPIFFGSLTAQTKILIDRCQCCWVAKYLLHKPFFPPESKIPGVFLSVGGMSRYQFFQNAQQIVKIWFTNMNIHYLSELFYPGIEQKGEILQHTSAIQKTSHLGKYLARIIQEK